MTEPTLPAGTRSSPLLLRSYRKQYPTAVRGEGVYLWDSEGNRYLDSCSSAVVSFIGHGVPEVADAITSQAKQLEFAHSSQFISEVTEQFARDLLDFLGPPYQDASVFFTSGGSEAVETAIKLARQYQVETGNSSRAQIVSRKQSYHGATFGAMAVSGNLKRREREGYFKSSRLRPAKEGDERSAKVRSGSSGGYRAALGEVEAERIDAYIREHLDPVFGYSAAGEAPLRR